METTKRETRQRMYDTLLTALQRPQEENQRKFAAREAIPYSKGFILKSFNVEGAGELHLPLSAEDASKLRRVCEDVPFGNGLYTTMNTEVRRQCQVDASKVTFPRNRTFLSDTVQSLAVTAVRALGLDGALAQLEVHLSKLLVYETGGPVTFPRDTEKEKGIFATLTLQLPTEEGYTGGELLVEHRNGVKLFDSQIISRVGFCSTICFADCLREHRRIKSGSILCLAFNLVNGDSSWDPVHRDYISSRVQKAEAALEPWLKEATERKWSTFGEKLAIPLQEKYTEEDLSLPLLEGSDKLMADVLKGCRDKNKDKCLDLHLCLVTKRKYGELLDPEYYDAAGLTRFHKVVEEDIQFKWIGLNNETALAFQKLQIDMEKELVGNGEDPFDCEADEKEYEGPGGQKGLCSIYGKVLPVFELRFHKAMLVAWPKALSIVLACETGVPSALDHLENTSEIGDPNFCRQLHQIIRYCENHAFKVWGARADCIDSVTPRLINLCKQANALEDGLLTFQLLAKTFPYEEKSCSYFDAEIDESFKIEKSCSYFDAEIDESFELEKSFSYLNAEKDESFKIGVRNIEVAEAIAAAIEVFGWESVSASVIDLVKKCALGQGEAFAEIARQLVIAGNVDAGEQVASTMPEFTMRQPLAILPDYPEIEMFLRGPREEFVHRGLPNSSAARSFAERYFNTYQEKFAYAGYSAVGTPGGLGRDAFCKICKTRRVFDIAREARLKERENLTRLKHGVERRMSAVSELSSRTVTTSPNSSGQPESKRQRLDTKETPKTEKSTAAL